MAAEYVLSIQPRTVQIKMLASNSESLVFLQKQKSDAATAKASAAAGNNEKESSSKFDNKWQRARNRNHG